MKTHLNEIPRRPFPNVPEPEQPQRPRVQQPTVYVYEKQAWEYKVVTRNIADDSVLSEEELNAIGASGWELVGVVTLQSKAQFYFKRVRT